MKISRSLKRIITNFCPPLLLLSMFSLFGVLIADAAHGAGAGSRAKECVSPGDSKVSMEIAKNVVAHSIKIWDIADLVDATTTEKAEKNLYRFIERKVGNTTIVCAMYIKHGQDHFNKGYNDEAVAFLLGTDLGDLGVGDKADIQLSKEQSKKLKSLLKKGEGPLADYLSNKMGWDEDTSKQIITYLSAPATAAVDRIGFNIPKKWNYGKKAAKALIAAKRKAMEKQGEKE